MYYQNKNTGEYTSRIDVVRKYYTQHNKQTEATIKNYIRHYIYNTDVELIPG